MHSKASTSKGKRPQSRRGSLVSRQRTACKDPTIYTKQRNGSCRGSTRDRRGQSGVARCFPSGAREPTSHLGFLVLRALTTASSSCKQGATVPCLVSCHNRTTPALPPACSSTYTYVALDIRGVLSTSKVSLGLYTRCREATTQQ